MPRRMPALASLFLLCVPAHLASAQDSVPDAQAFAAQMAGACARGEAEPCWRSGVLTARGWGVARDLERAAAYFQTACAADHRQSCGELAALTGRGIRPARIVVVPPPAPEPPPPTEAAGGLAEVAPRAAPPASTDSLRQLLDPESVALRAHRRPHRRSGPSDGAIAGIVIGGVAALTAVVLVVIGIVALAGSDGVSLGPDLSGFRY